MKGMPLPLESFQGEVVFDFRSSSSPFFSSDFDSSCCYAHNTFPNIIEPRSVLEPSPSPPTSSSTISSSPDAAGLANIIDFSPVDADKCGPRFGFQDLATVSASRQNSTLRSILGDMEDYTFGYNKMLQHGASHELLGYNNGVSFGMVDLGFDADATLFSNVNQFHNPNMLPVLNPASNSSMLLQLPYQLQEQHLMVANGSDVELINHISQAAELLESGNPVRAQGILARLNHHLSLPLGKPPQRVAFYFKEALNLVLNSMNGNSVTARQSSLSTYNLIYKIGAYKSFSEISPVLQFANFTSNQALLEAFEGGQNIHIVDFDLGYGSQWASLMQELAMKGTGAPALKITAFASPCHDELELAFTEENLKMFARDLNMAFEMEVVSIEKMGLRGFKEDEIRAVNLPMGSIPNYGAMIRFVKQLSPKIVVSLESGCDRNDVSFTQHVNQAIQSYTVLLESLDAVNMNHESVQKIERFWIQAEIERVVLNRHRCPNVSPSWRRLLLQSGFSPLAFSHVAESQAECLVQRCPVRGFHVEKKHSSLVLAWHRKDLISASAWTS